MKKIVSVLLCLVMMMSLCTVAFAEHDCWRDQTITYKNLHNGKHLICCTECDATYGEAECVFTDGVCLPCGNTESAATHECTSFTYKPLTKTTHQVICADPDCGKIVTESTPCVFETGKCVCGNEEAKCDHSQNHWKYDPTSETTHNVICTDCDTIVTKNAACVFEDGNACVCGNEEAKCDHMGNHWIYTPVTAITHSVTCADCKVVETASTECVFTDGKCICGNVEPSCDHMANNWTYTPVTATTHSVTCNVCKAVVTESTPCVFTDGKCICGNVEPDCDHMGNHWIYTPVTKTTHSVTCADCNVVVTASTECVFEDGNPCVCGNVECKHEGAQKLVPNKDKKTHNAYCPVCNELMAEKIPHTYQYDKNGEFVGRGGKYCLCGAKKPASSGGSTTGTTTATTKSPKTGDMGVVLYAATALLSLSGTAVVIKKRKNDK